MTSQASFIKSETLSALAGIDHAFFTRKGGASSGIYKSRNIGLGSKDQRDDVLENRTRCAADLGIDVAMLVNVYQIHSPTVVTVDNVWAPGDGPKADGMVTARPGIMLGIATADCGPVLFADNTAKVVGAAHAGWRGATGGVLESTIAAMEALGANRSNITAVLGPTIAQASYEVGPEFVSNLTKIAPQNTKYLIPSHRENHALFDLPQYIVDRLEAAGIKAADNINLDTYEDEERFYSYRRTTHRGEADYGRLLSAIVLRG